MASSNTSGGRGTQEGEAEGCHADQCCSEKSFAQVSGLLLELQATHSREVEDLRQEQQREIAELKRQLDEARCGECGSAGPAASSAPFRAGPVDSLVTSSVEQQKQQFIKFVMGALAGKDSPEYKQLYHFLLKCFTDSDNNFDGRIGFLEFEMLIEIAASLPRRFGYAPSTPELYKNDTERLNTRIKLYNILRSAATVNDGGSSGKRKDGQDGFVSFSTWLEYVLGHIKEKASNLKEVDTRSPWDSSKDEFRNFVCRAAKSRTSREYKQFYYFVLKCFTDSDEDMDGRIDAKQFDALIDIAAQTPRRWGFAPATTDMYASDQEREEARAKIFRSLDPEETGYIEFDTWLHYIYEHICEKIGDLGDEPGSPPALLKAVGLASSRTACPFVP